MFIADLTHPAYADTGITGCFFNSQTDLVIEGDVSFVDDMKQSSIIFKLIVQLRFCLYFGISVWLFYGLLLRILVLMSKLLRIRISIRYISGFGMLVMYLISRDLSIVKICSNMTIEGYLSPMSSGSR